MKRLTLLACLCCVSFSSAERILLKDALGIGASGGSRSPVRIDPIELARVRTGKIEASDGQTVGNRTWKAVSANKDGVFEGGPTNGGYLLFHVNRRQPGIMLLEAQGHSTAFINGVPRTGDPYSFGYVSIPVELKAGDNILAFSCGRGRFHGELVDPSKSYMLDLRDATLPDIVVGETRDLYGAVVVKNCTAKSISNLSLDIENGEGKKRTTEVSPIPPLGIRKVGFKMAVGKANDYSITLSQNGKEADTAKFTLRARQPRESYKRTFVSSIDGSVQYYGVQPCSGDPKGQALILSLHGASVEAIGQADAYSPKSWATIVAATNRRPFGFDWEDVGRLDAIEVLDQAMKEFRADPTRVYLTGHSMGGHGTWQIGAHFPSRFAAIAPSAGWCSFNTYAGGMRIDNPNELEKLLLRAANPSETLVLKQNFAQAAVYVLHGDADDNVPVSEARNMRKALDGFHHDLHWFEQPGAGHWWDVSDEPGADCVDWAPMMDLFSKRRIPQITEIRKIDFTTVSPGISANCHWLTVEQQEHALMPTHVVAQVDPHSRRFTITTDNCSRLSLDLGMLPSNSAVSITIDGTKLDEVAWPYEAKLNVSMKDGKWTISERLNPDEKGPHRNGLFKDIFRNRVVFVYGTSGTKDDQAWALAKARFDAETFWYRGNASVDVVSDIEFEPGAEPDRNVILYGNSETNKLYKTLIGGTSPIQIAPKSVQIAPSVSGWKRDDLAAVFIRPRRGSKTASVACVGGTGIVGSRVTDRLPFFLSGAAFPDALVMESATLENGSKGFLFAGFFGNDWSLTKGDFSVAAP